jgi:DUF2075 family protein
MPAYVTRTLSEFVSESPDVLSGELNRAYARDGFASQYTSQTRAWGASIPAMQDHLRTLQANVETAGNWRVLLELPLYRLRRRIDLLVLTDHAVVVIELKVGAEAFTSTDERQVEEYALDLRDFHGGSDGLAILPCLWATEADHEPAYSRLSVGVNPVQRIGKRGLASLLEHVANVEAALPTRVGEDWESAPYRPVPTVIQAATTLFAGHGVREITHADATNLEQSAARIIELLVEAREEQGRYLILLSGVPGSGKTLAGLQVVHEAVATGAEAKGDIVYLSGNTPLVVVLREALARDEHDRRKRAGEESSLREVRTGVRARIQHIIDYLQQYLIDDSDRPPHEHVIVFDEAQRAWNADFGQQRFERPASEPQLLLEIMGRHPEWCAMVCLIGGGQEINTGENGMAEWGEAIRSLSPEDATRWTVVGPPDVLAGDETTAGLGLGELPAETSVREDPLLRLRVPLRSYRSSAVSDWVSSVLEGDAATASSLVDDLSEYPILLTRDLERMRSWLRSMSRGERRSGLLATSGARRLRADGLGVTLNATDGAKIAHWYLNEPGDVRSSFALEVTANEYTSQGLELDYCGVCWGGDLIWSDSEWTLRRFHGAAWNRVSNAERRRFLINSYRVLLTRAREGMVIWVPAGSEGDPTRTPDLLNRTYDFLSSCGLRDLSEEDV